MAQGSTQIKLAPGANYFGLATVDIGSGSVGIKGNITLSDSKGFIGIVTVGNTPTVNIQGNLTLSDSKTFIGLVTVGNTVNTTLTGNVTLSDSKGFIGLVTIGNRPDVSVVGNVTLTDSKTFIGLVTAVLANGNPTVQAFGQYLPTLQSMASGALGPIQLDVLGRLITSPESDPKSYIGLITIGGGLSNVNVLGNLTLTDSKTFIGLTTTVLGNSLPAGQNFVGLMTVTVGAGGTGFQTVFQGGSPWNVGVVGNLTLSDSKGFIGLTTVVQASSVRSISGNITLADSKTYIGLVTIGGGLSNVNVLGNLTLSDSQGFIGLVTVVQASSNRSIIGNLTLSDSKTFIGLVTAVIAGGAGTTTVFQGGAPWSTSVVGNLTLTDSKGFIGLVTAVISGSVSGFQTVFQGGSPWAVGGDSAAGASDSGNPVKVGGVYTTTKPTLTNGQRGNIVLDSRGNTNTALFLQDTGQSITGYVDNADGVAVTALQRNLAVVNRNTVFNGTSWDRMYGDITNGIDVDVTRLNGNLTLSDSKGFIGLVTAVISGSVSGYQTVFQGGSPWSTEIVGNLTLSDSKTFIGLVTAVLGPGNITVTLGTNLSGANDSIAILGNLTLTDSKGFIGLVTVVQSSSARTITGNLTLSDSKGFIGLVTVVQSSTARTITGNLTLSDSKGFIGLVTVGNTVNTAVIGNLTLTDSKGFIGLVTAVLAGSLGGYQTVFQGGAPWSTSVVGNLTLSDSKGFIGLTTVVQASSARTITGNLTLTDAKTYIGLVTLGGGLTGISGNLTLSDSKGFIGLVTAVLSGALGGYQTVFQGGSPWSTSVVGNLTLSDSKTYIGLVTATLGPGLVTVTMASALNYTADSISTGQYLPTLVSLASGAYSPLLTDVFGRQINTIAGNLTLSDSKTFIGLVTVGNTVSSNIIGNITLSDPKTFIGLVTVVQSSSARTITGNLTLSNSKGFIGLVTVVQSSSARTITGNLTLSDSKGFIGLVTVVPSYPSLPTVVTAIISASGNTTVIVPTASTRFFINNLHVSSLGRAEVEIKSGASTLIPFTGLATTGGYIHNFGDGGLPARLVNDALVVNLNGAATIAIMANLRFA